MAGPWRRRAILVWTAAVCAGTTACNRRLLNALFDFPASSPAEPQPVVAAPEETALRLAALETIPEDTVRPEIERFLDPDSVKARLPRDHAGNVDWMAALRDGTIQPRRVMPGGGREPPADGFEFAFEFFFPGPDSTLDAYFPHSAHTEWVDCRQCHARIFRFRGTRFTMGDIFQGKYCGECHGKVAFPLTTGCERCHLKLSMPANRAQPDLIGTVVLKRVPPPPRTVEPGAEGSAGGSAPDRAAPDAPPPRRSGFRTEDLLPAQFPHWLHRIRFRCNVCHVELFEPRAGANEITMADIAAGRACGACHNGSVAFASGFGDCQRCHASP